MLVPEASMIAFKYQDFPLNGCRFRLCGVFKVVLLLIDHQPAIDHDPQQPGHGVQPHADVVPGVGHDGDAPEVVLVRFLGRASNKGYLKFSEDYTITEKAPIRQATLPRGSMPV